MLLQRGCYIIYLSELIKRADFKILYTNPQGENRHMYLQNLMHCEAFRIVRKTERGALDVVTAEPPRHKILYLDSALCEQDKIFVIAP